MGVEFSVCACFFGPMMLNLKREVPLSCLILPRNLPDLTCLSRRDSNREDFPIRKEKREIIARRVRDSQYNLVCLQRDLCGE